MHTVWVTSSLVTDLHNPSKFHKVANIQINTPPLTFVPYIKIQQLEKYVFHILPLTSPLFSFL